MDTEIAAFLTGAGKAETIWNVMDVLKAGPAQHQHCFDLALAMQNRDLVKLLYSQYPDKVMVEITLVGAARKSQGAG